MSNHTLADRFAIALRLEEAHAICDALTWYAAEHRALAARIMLAPGRNPYWSRATYLADLADQLRHLA